jgi:hypothetical protein
MDVEPSEEPDPAILSQTASAHFQRICFFVQEHHPTRLDEFIATLHAAQQANEDPAIIDRQTHSWPLPPTV